jgi:hypothetical protein
VTNVIQVNLVDSLSDSCSEKMEFLYVQMHKASEGKPSIVICGKEVSQLFEACSAFKPSVLKRNHVGWVCDSCGCPTAKFVGEEPQDPFYELGTLNQYRFYVDKKMGQYTMIVCIENGGGIHTIEVVNEANTP